MTKRKWRSSAQLAAYKGQVTKAIKASTDGATCEMPLGTAYALLEIIEQAAHTEREHEPH